MKNIRSVLVVCIDRDNDLGRKTGIQGPVIGKKSILTAAAKLAVADPEESDANCMFAAVQKWEEIKNEFKSSEVACLTGVDKSGFSSDRKVLEQLEIVLEKNPSDALVLVTDGAEDEQVIPILQSRLPIISKHQVIIKQAKEVESTFYTIKEALKEPEIARLVFGVPGIILLLFFAIGSLSLQIVALILGIYLLIKGFGIEEILFQGMESMKNNFSIQRPSFPFLLGGIFILAFAILTVYTNFINSPELDLLTNLVQALQRSYVLLFLAGECLILGNVVNALHLKKAFRLPEHGILAISLFLVWIILDAGTEVFLKKADLNWFLGTIIFSFAILILVFRFARTIDIRTKVSNLLIGFPVYGKDGHWIGNVEKVNKNKSEIEYKENKSKENKTLGKEKFRIHEGKIILAA